MSEYIWVVRDCDDYAADYCETYEEAVGSAVYYNSEFPEHRPFVVHEEKRIHEFDPRGE